MEINSNSDKFANILQSFKFTKEDELMPDRDLNHWDIRDGRVCVQVITYARQNKSSACQAFGTPCEVPDYWEVCDQSNVK